MRVSETLEHLILCSLIQGYADIKTVQRDELTRQGQFVYDGLHRLMKNKKPPFNAKTVLSAAVDIAGGDADELRPFIAKCLDSRGGGSAQEILNAVHEKQALVKIVNMASNQMARGEFNRQQFMELVTTAGAQGKGLSPASDDFEGDSVHTMPEGLPLPDLPLIQKATHGLFGVWALSGDSGVGKSTLTMMFAIQAGRHRPVLFYDYENGQAVLKAHLYQAFDGDNKKIRAATRRLYFRDSIYSLDADLVRLAEPCFIVVDSLQKIAVRGSDDKRAGIEKWVHRLEALKLLGHCVLMVSEKNRSHYGRTGQAGYKESGEIEYTVDVGMELLEDKERRGVVAVSLNKNRNWEVKDYICSLTRHNNWWFREINRDRKDRRPRERT